MKNKNTNKVLDTIKLNLTTELLNLFEANSLKGIVVTKKLKNDTYYTITKKSKTLTLFGLEFSYNGTEQCFRLILRYYYPSELLNLLNAFMQKMHDVNKNGYLQDKAISGRFMLLISHFLLNKGFKLRVFGNTELTYSMWFNFMFVNFYRLLLLKIDECKSIEIEKLGIDSSHQLEELLCALETARVDLLGRLEQYIKFQFQWRGITLIQNSYCGFDTEYEVFNEGKNLNKLISAQTAIQRRSIIKVPAYHNYDISYVHPLNSCVSNTYNSKVGMVDNAKYKFTHKNSFFVNNKFRKDLDEITILNNSLKHTISLVKEYSMGPLISVNELIIERLKEAAGVENFYYDSKHDQFVFIFPLSSLVTNIVYPENGKFSFQDLVEMTKCSNTKTKDCFSIKTKNVNNCSSLSLEDLSKFSLSGFASPQPNISCSSPLINKCINNSISLETGVSNINTFNTLNSFKGGSSSADHPAPALSTVNVVNDNNTFRSSHFEDFFNLINIFDNLGLSNDKQALFDWYLISVDKARFRKRLVFNTNTNTNTNTKGTPTSISISIIKNLFIISHNNASEFSMLQDFEELKLKLSIVGKCFVTLGKPLSFSNTNIYIRDTMLLAPGGKQKLKDLGKLYENEGDFSKIDIHIEDIEHMNAFLKRDKKAFEDYAIRDAVITLKHALQMERFNMELKQLGVPTTLSSIGRNYVFEQWSSLFKKHLPYQISGEYMMGNANELQTPKGLFATGDVGAHMSYYIANYKGGRNESFMYGVDENTHWYDYDLVSAYTTGMADIDLPDYKNYSFVNQKQLQSWSVDQLLAGFLIVNADFEFPKFVKYPSIPCYIDKTTTVYPLKGTAFLTGAEYLLAKRQGAVFNIKMAFHIKSKGVFENNTFNKSKKTLIKPFKGIIKDVQAKRRIFPKGHINNLLYKEMGNGIYGNVVRGMSDKKTFDSVTGETKRVYGTPLSNPIIASWTTAFIRSIIGECLHNIHKLGGKVVSTTTDGFITDLENLEEKLLKLPPEDTILLRKYRATRKDLSNCPEALEIKSDGKGIISWTTRGQLGIASKIVAATGFQRLGYIRDELVTIFKNTLASDKKYFEFTRNSLRSAKDVFDKGGHVLMAAKEQTFRMFYDNRRKILEPLSFKSFDLSKNLFDSEPLVDIDACRTRRYISKFPITIPFNKNNTNRGRTAYKTKLEIGVRNFIKAYFSSSDKFGLAGNEFRFDKDILTFITAHKPTKGIRISVKSISNLKRRKLIWKSVPCTDENQAFVKYIKEHYPNFRDNDFLRSKITPAF